jgi:type 1 glutamine amidotransferase
MVAALIAVPSASAQDTTAPTLNVGTLSPTSSVPQRGGNPPAAPNTSTGNNGWFTHAGPVVLNLSATDAVGVDKLQYSLDNGANWLDVAITPGPSVTGTASITQEGNTTVRYRALDAAGNASRGVSANTTLNQAAVAGASGVRLQSTNGRGAGDELVINTGDGQETVRIAAVVNRPSPQPNVDLVSPLTKAHAAGAAVVATPFYRTIAVPIDTRVPTAAFPTVVNNRIGHSQTVTPTRTDPTPGSGQTAVRDTWIDGTWTYPLPLDASRLSLGKHSWTIGVGDNAGLGNKVTLTFNVVTSFADLDALVTRFGGASAADLRAKLTAAKTASDAGDKNGAIAQLEAFVSQARGLGDAKARELLAGDAQELIRVERGITSPEPSGLGITSEVYPGAARHPYVRPAMPTSSPNAKFRVLVISQRPDGFRHPAIEDGHVLIQQLGQQYGFDVDIWDYNYPAESLPDTPFTSASDLLSKYKVIIGNSSVGLNTFRTAYTKLDGTVVNEQAAFEGFIRGGGGFVAIHGADDSMGNWPFYADMLGGVFRAHPGNAGGFGTDCGSCYWAELITEDDTHPATAGLPARFSVADELYQYNRKPRPYVHPLLLLNEDTYKTAIGVTGTGAIENGDHPITYCSNYEGGRMFAQVLGHNWQLFSSTPWFQKTVLEAILTTGGMKYANCVTHREVNKLIAAGGLTTEAAAAATALVNSAYDKYATLTQTGYSASLSDINALRDLAQQPGSGDAAARGTLLAKAQELKDWMLVLLGSESQSGGVSGTVPATLSLSLGSAPSFGAFTPGVANTYTAGGTANVISSAGDALLSVADPSATATGRLVNGSFSLASPVRARAASALGAGAAFAAVGGSSSPTSLLTYSGPVSNDAVTLSFEQAIGANEALRTGSYSKTLTFTLSTTTP